MKVLNARLETGRIEDSPIYEVRYLPNLSSIGHFVFQTETLNELRKLIGFKEMRFRCSSTGVYMHIKTTPYTEGGQVSVTYLSSYEIRYPPPFCESFAALHDDKSGVLQNCTNTVYLAGSIFGDSMIAIHNIWKAGIFGWFCCVKRGGQLKPGDFWEAFVR